VNFFSYYIFFIVIFSRSGFFFYLSAHWEGARHQKKSFATDFRPSLSFFFDESAEKQHILTLGY